jgi:tRNA1(Val) A37 N6-methylase TrmN6
MTIVKNTTIQNRSKQEKLANSHTIPFQNISNPAIVKFLQEMIEIPAPKEQILYSIGCKLLENNENPNVKFFLNSYKQEILEIENIPLDEFDLLGTLYQYLNSKIENLEKGSFYTGIKISEDMVSDLRFDSDEVIFDPSCGSGSFLFRSNAKAHQIYGIDLDPIAIMIAKFNYFVKFPDAAMPNLYCVDFFNWYAENTNLEFNYIIGNPPYGANIDISRILMSRVTSGESFSYFIEFCYRLLREGGIFRFLLPESILNVKRHTDIRDFILEETNLRRIKKYDSKFSGVMSDVYLIELDHDKTANMIFEDNVSTEIPKSLFFELKNHIFAHLTELDIAIISRVDAMANANLSSSIFGLGVVTGDNKSKLFSNPVNGSEIIYTGKEVEKYFLSPAKNHIVFDRTQLQQVAPDEIYRAPEKLVYKTISKYLKVAIDKSSSLTSNSANIIIPKIEDLTIETIAALLNSKLYSFLNIKLFGGVNKIAKENLMALTFPKISTSQQSEIARLIHAYKESLDDSPLQDYIHRVIFHLDDEEIAYIDEVNTL